MSSLQLSLSVTLLIVASCCWLTKADRVVTCDPGADDQFLFCGHRLIVIEYVQAGHSDRDVCLQGRPPSTPPDPYCYRESTQRAVAKRCDGKHRCKVRMQSCHLSYPCRTRCRYMDTTYTCVTGRIVRVCQKMKARLSCGSRVIKVLRANYGRTSSWVCPYRETRLSVNITCTQPSTLQEITNRCDGRSSCTVLASNSVFSNPCPGTFKYLKFSYTCVPVQ